MNVDRRTIQEKQLDPVAGVWACHNCGRRIQVIADGDTPKVGPFVCVCGSDMLPGEEHGRPDKDMQRKVIDD